METDSLFADNSHCEENQLITSPATQKDRSILSSHQWDISLSLFRVNSAFFRLLRHAERAYYF